MTRKRRASAHLAFTNKMGFIRHNPPIPAQVVLDAALRPAILEPQQAERDTESRRQISLEKSAEDGTRAHSARARLLMAEEFAGGKKGGPCRAGNGIKDAANAARHPTALHRRQSSGSPSTDLARGANHARIKKPPVRADGA